MKKIIILSIMLYGLASGLKAQDIAFTYDEGGNLTSRYVITLKSAEDLSGEPATAAEKPLHDPATQTKIYPNPTRGLVIFELPGEGETLPVVTIKVYSLSGRLIHNQQQQNLRIETDLSMHPAGTYLVELVVNNRRQNYTIIKQ